jgi:cytochrome P450
MSKTVKRAMRQRDGRRLPPSPHHPAIAQTLGGRWWPYGYLEHCQKKCGDRFTLYPVDMPPIVFLADPQDIREVLTGDPTKLHPGAGAAIIAPLIGQRSFMLLEEEEHAYGRSTVSPAFHKRMVAQQTAALTSVVERAVASWPVGRPVPIHTYIRSLTLAVILNVIFSDSGRELAMLHGLLSGMLTITDTFLLQEPKLRHLPGWRGTWRRFVAQRREVDQLICGLIECRRSNGIGHQCDLLDMLLMTQNAEGASMADEQIRDNLMSMILAGHETTTGELAWAFQLIAHNPGVQDLLVEEVKVNEDDEYLTATIHETMRHKPVFLFTIPREVIAPIEVGGWIYQPPAHLAACTYLMHHNPELYPEPHSFRPERFLGAAPQSRTWLPWGGGRKHCLGRHFAMLEVKAIIRQVLSTRRVLPVGERVERPRWRSAILVPSKGGRVILRA